MTKVRTHLKKMQDVISVFKKGPKAAVCSETSSLDQTNTELTVVPQSSLDSNGLLLW